MRRFTNHSPIDSRRRSLPLFLFLLMPLGLQADAAVLPDWAVIFDSGANDELIDMTTDATGNIYLTGTRGNYPDTDLELVKYAPDGTELWSRIYDGAAAGQDIAQAVAVDNAGRVYIVGRAKGFGTLSDFVTICYDADDGTLLWDRLYDGPSNSVDQANDVAANAHGVYVTGVVQGTGSDYATVAYSPDGTLLWDVIYNGLGSEPFANDYPESIAIDPNGDVVVTGQAAAFNGIEDYCTIKYRASDGNQLWLERYTGSGANDIALHMEIDVTGDVYVTGRTYQLGEKFATIRYDGQTGGVVWVAIDNPGVHDRIHGIELAGDRVYITGSSDPDGDESNGNDNVYTACYSKADGSTVWNAYHGTNAWGEWDGGLDLIADGAGHLYVTGRTNSFGAEDDILLLRYDAEIGTELDRTTHDGPAGGWDTGWTIGREPNGDVVVAAMTYATTKNFLTLRFAGPAIAGIGEPAATTAPVTRLLQNTPNPARLMTTIGFELAVPAHVDLSVYDVQGRSVATLVDGSLGAGFHSFDFEAAGMAPGVYFYRLRGGGLQETRKMLIVE